jgi:predicted MFS family arabinose efflux permease
MLRLTPNRDFRLIWTGGIVSQLGDWSARLALALLVLERSGSATTVGVVAALFMIPWLGVGQLVTSWSARFPRRIVLVICDTCRGIAFVMIGTFETPTVVLLVIVALAALADPVFEATKSAFVTEIVSKEDYAEAIQVSHAANQASSLIGYGLGGVLVGLFGASLTLSLNGLSFLLSSLLIVRVSSKGRSESIEASKPSLAAGLGFLRSDPISAVAFLATVAAVTTAMSVESQVAVYGTVVAGFSAEIIGVLSAMTPAVTLVAVALLKTSGADAVLLRRGLVSAAVAAVGASALLFLGVGSVLAFVAFALVGVIFSFVTMTNVVVGRRLPDDNRVAIFSILQSGVFLGLSAGALLGGVISEATSPQLAAGGAMAIGALILVVAVPFVSRQSEPTTTSTLTP